MILYPNCKINLGLNIVGKRTDGYHDIETLFLPIPLCDCLEITPAHEDSFVMAARSQPLKFFIQDVRYQKCPSSGQRPRKTRVKVRHRLS